jgi:hypothetical protein
MALALGIGAAVGVGIAATWVPRRRRRRRRLLPDPLAQRYRRRRSSRSRVDDIRNSSQELLADFREELAANLEAARAEFGDMARQQLRQLRGTLRRERSKTLG